MGKRSTKEKKTVYQERREALGYSREKAAELIGFISDDRIEKIENRGADPHPDEILAMSRVYKDASLPNYYCTHECPIGIKYEPVLELGGLREITLRLLNAMNHLEKQKDRLIEISVDGRVNENERDDFRKISEDLKNISVTAKRMEIWIEQQELNANQK